MTKKLWVALCITLTLGIFSLSVQPTAANTSQISPQNETGGGNILIYGGIILSIILIGLIIKRWKTVKTKI